MPLHFLTATRRVDKTHCSYKEVPYPLLFLSPAQLLWRLHSHLFQGLPAITWLLYSRNQFFTFFGLSSHFSPQAIRHISFPIIPRSFLCVSHIIPLPETSIPVLKAPSVFHPPSMYHFPSQQLTAPQLSHGNGF